MITYLTVNLNTEIKSFKITLNAYSSRNTFHFDFLDLDYSALIILWKIIMLYQMFERNLNLDDSNIIYVDGNKNAKNKSYYFFGKQAFNKN